MSMNLSDEARKAIGCIVEFLLSVSLLLLLALGGLYLSAQFYAYLMRG